MPFSSIFFFISLGTMLAEVIRIGTTNDKEEGCPHGPSEPRLRRHCQTLPSPCSSSLARVMRQAKKWGYYLNSVKKLITHIGAGLFVQMFFPASNWAYKWYKVEGNLSFVDNFLKSFFYGLRFQVFCDMCPNDSHDSLNQSSQSHWLNSIHSFLQICSDGSRDTPRIHEKKS